MDDAIRPDRPWILAIDQTKLQLRTYEQMFAASAELGRFGLECHAGGEEALRRLAGLGARGLKPSLILLDWSRSARADSGPNLLGRLREDFRWSRIPVLAVSAAPEKDDLPSAMRLGAQDTLLKPIRPALLAEKVLRHAAVRTPAAGGGAQAAAAAAAAQDPEPPAASDSPAPEAWPASAPGGPSAGIRSRPPFLYLGDGWPRAGTAERTRAHHRGLLRHRPRPGAPLRPGRARPDPGLPEP